MNDQIKARGWLWVRSEKPTQWVEVECYYCEETMTYPSNAHQKTYCKVCGGANLLKGYVRKVRMIKG